MVEEFPLGVQENRLAARAEGGIENLEAQLKKEFGLEGDAAIAAEIARLTEEERRDTERLTALETELRGLTDWGAV